MFTLKGMLAPLILLGLPIEEIEHIVTDFPRIMNRQPEMRKSSGELFWTSSVAKYEGNTETTGTLS